VALKQADPNYARPRITDLLHRGVLVEDGTTFDEATRRTVRRLAIAPYQSRLELIA
jgi:hypothetical protein